MQRSVLFLSSLTIYRKQRPMLKSRNVVKIYVERSVAKVKVALGNDVANVISDKLALKDKKVKISKSEENRFT